MREQARVVKLAVNLMIGGLAQLMSEALVFGEAPGVSRAALLDVMGASAAGAPFVKYKTEPLLNDDYSATFTTALMEKDIDLVLDAAEDAVVELPVPRELKALLRAAHRSRVRRRRLHRALPVPAERVPGSRPGGSAVTMRNRSVGSPDATRAVDWEQRIDFPRLRQDRLGRAKAALETSDLGAVLMFDPNNIRYVTSTHIGEWARDKNARFALLPRGGDPILWDFGSAARHHQLFAPWLPPENFRAGVAPMRGAMPVETGIPDRLGERIANELREFGVLDEPLGVDMADLVTIEALQRAGVQVTDGSQVLLEARKIKTSQEIALLDQSAGLVDAVYEEIYRMLRPGRLRTRDRRPRTPALVRDGIRARRGDQRGLRRSLQPTSARVLRPSAATRATRRSSTSSTRSWATGRATTARSTWAE